ncbi:hypothetical protein [Arthrobacter sp. TMS1-12-1]
MLLTGTIRRGDDINTIDHIGAEDADYAAARATLVDRLPDGYKIIAIWTDK